MTFRTAALIACTVLSAAARLRAQPGVEGVLLSGSGSACFALLTPDADIAKLTAIIRDALARHP